MNAPHSSSFDDLLTRYSNEAQRPVPVSSDFSARVAEARQVEVARSVFLKRLTTGIGLLVLIVAGVILLQPKTMTVKEERATRQTTEAPYRLSDWNVDVAKLPERATTPAKGLFSSIQRVTLPTSSTELPLKESLPKLSAVPQAAASSLDPLTSGPRRAMTLFLRDTGFGSH